jgi:hypothetical protein
LAALLGARCSVFAVARYPIAFVLTSSFQPRSTLDTSLYECRYGLCLYLLVQVCHQPTSKFSCDKRVSYVKGWYGVNITCRTTLALKIYLFENIYYQPLGIRYRYLGVTIHPSKVFYTLDTQIARYLDGDLGVYRPAIGPGRHTGQGC